jgi:hypothetical protein
VRQRSGDAAAVPAVLEFAAVVAVLLASAGHALIAAKPQVMLQTHSMSQLILRSRKKHSK